MHSHVESARATTDLALFGVRSCLLSTRTSLHRPGSVPQALLAHASQALALHSRSGNARATTQRQPPHVREGLAARWARPSARGRGQSPELGSRTRARLWPCTRDWEALAQRRNDRPLECAKACPRVGQAQAREAAVSPQSLARAREPGQASPNASLGDRWHPCTRSWKALAQRRNDRPLECAKACPRVGQA